MKPPDPKVKPVPTSPGTNVTAFDPDGLFKPNKSLVFPSPVHQLTSPGGAAEHVSDPVIVNVPVAVP
jgi:hypothetical protein